MKSLPANLLTHVGLETTTLAHALKITRKDSSVYAFTSASEDSLISGVLYKAAQGLDISTLESSSGFNVDNLELTTLDDGTTFTHADIYAGRWKNADFAIYRYNAKSPTDGVDTILVGTIGDVYVGSGRVTAELRGLQQYLQQTVGAVTNRTCRARLGDSACSVNTASYTASSSVTQVTSNQVFATGMGGDPYYSSVTLLLHGDGANGGTTFTDNSPLAQTMSVGYGAPVTSTAWSAFGGSSMYFNNARLDTPVDAVNGFSGDFTIECVVRMQTFGNQFILSIGNNPNSANGAAILSLSTTFRLYVAGVSRITGPAYSYGTGVSHHIMVTRASGVWTMYVDGVSYGTYSNSVNLNQNQIMVGATGWASEYLIQGYLDEVRITKGVARPNAGVPVEAHPNSGGQFADNWFDEGILTFTSGANANISQKVKTYTTLGQMTLSLPMPLSVAVGDAFNVVAGCRKRLDEDCKTKFNNVINFQGEPHLPGIDSLA